jgi:uncharacterized membrane protein
VGLKKTSLLLMVVFYLLSGINHFLNANFYVAIIPSYLPAHIFLNYLSGFLEITFAGMLLFTKTRWLGCWLIILMLIAFLPVHIDMIIEAANGAYNVNNTTITNVLVWGRIPFQLLFICWAYWCSKLNFSIFGRTVEKKHLPF